METKTTMVTTGVVAFSNLTKHEVYEGKDTGRFSLVCTMSDADASILEDMGVNVKTYDGKKQRKFASKFFVPVVDLEDAPFQGELPYGSVVRLLWVAGPSHPEHKVPTYLNRVRLVELADGIAGETPEEF